MLIVSFAWNGWHRFSGCLPAHSTGCLFFRAELCVHFSCLAPVASFPALYFTYLLLARNWLRLFHWFKLLASFPALGAGCVFSHAGQYLHHFPRSMVFCLFPRQTRLASSPGLDAGSVFPGSVLTQVAFSNALCPVPFFLRLNQLASSFAVDAGSVFFPHLNQLASSYAVDAGCVFSRS